MTNAILRWGSAAPDEQHRDGAATLSESEVECLRLRSTLEDERRRHGVEIETLTKTVEGLKHKLRAAEERARGR